MDEQTLNRMDLSLRQMLRDMAELHARHLTDGEEWKSNITADAIAELGWMLEVVRKARA